MVEAFTCPACGAPIEYEPGSGPTVRCPFCGNTAIAPEPLRGRGAPSGNTVSLSGLGGMDTAALVQLAELVAAGNKIEAIKRYRELTGTGLKEAKEAVERMQAGEPVQMVGLSTSTFTPTVARSESTPWGCLLGIIGLVVVIALIIGLAPLVATFFAVQAIPTDLPALDGSTVQDDASALATLHSSFGSEGIGPGLFSDTRAIALSGTGDLYTGDYSTGRVQRFDVSGDFRGQWMVDPEMPLRGLAADREGRVYVSQRGEILQYDGATGELLGRIGEERGGYDALAMAPDGSLIAVVGDDRIARFSPTGAQVALLEESLKDAGVSSIRAVAVDGVGTYHLFDDREHAVYKFAVDGRFADRFGSRGEGPGQIMSAHSLLVDGQGRIFVGDSHKVSVFGPDGRFLGAIPVEGVAFGMALSGGNELLVSTRDRIHRFTLN